MNNVKTFIKTYWQHAKSSIDLVLFIASLISFILGTEVTLAIAGGIQAGVVFLFIVVIVAAYRTWLYQYQQTLDLVESHEKELEFDDLNEIQKAILLSVSAGADKRIMSIRTLGGAIYIGVGDVGNSYSSDEIGAEIVELEKANVLRIDGHSSKSGRPIYAPTSLGFRILKQASAGDKDDK